LDRIVRIIRQLRIFSHPSQQDLGPVELEPIVRSVFALMDQELHGRVSLTMDSSEKFKVRANEDQLRQILLNLIINSAHSFLPSRTDGKIEVRCERQGSHIATRVTDNGCGIPSENLRRVFDPFFTTKPVGQGTGMGLAITRDLVQKMGGNIVLDSQADRGTSVSVILPECCEPQLEHREIPKTESSTAAALVASEKNQRISIVIIEDEISLLLPMRRMLAKQFDVLTFSDSLEGLRCLLDREPPDVVICDLNMPVMNGLELWRTVTAARPALAERFLFFTGGDSGNLLGSLKNSPHHILEKPVNRVELVAAIQEIAAKR
jgi:CheY-like chemotaxis protein